MGNQTFKIDSNAYWVCTVYPKKNAHGFCFAVLCCGYTLTNFPISIRLTSLALWQSNDCPSARKATLMNMDKYFMWINYERSHNHNKAKHNKTVCIFLGIYCIPWRYMNLSTESWSRMCFKCIKLFLWIPYINWVLFPKYINGYWLDFTMIIPVASPPLSTPRKQNITKLCAWLHSTLSMWPWPALNKSPVPRAATYVR